MDGTITVYYDGDCAICGREVALYRRLVEPGAVDWRDLAQGTAAIAGEPFDLAAALDLLHVREADGTLRIGLDAHLVLWARLPGVRHLAAALRAWPRLRTPFERLYRTFTRWRPAARARARRGCRDA